MKTSHSLGLVILAGGVALGCGSSTDTNAAGSGGQATTTTSSSGGSTTTTTTSSSTGAGGNASGGSSGTGGATADSIQTVFVIVMENKAWCEIDGSSDAPYINSTIMPAGATALGYTGPNGGNLHPSEPNYIWMEAGDNLGIYNDNDPAQNHQSTTDHLVTYLDAAGVSWKSYQEDITGQVCPLTSIGAYHPKHNPMIYFDDVTGGNDSANTYCIEHNRPFTELETDLTNGTVARYNFVIPNQCHDMHDACAPMDNRIAQGDAWLTEWIPKLQASPQYQSGGAIFLVFDEAETTLPSSTCCILGNCPIGMMVLSPLAKVGYTNDVAYDHSSLLKSLQEIFGITPLLRHAADNGVNTLSDLFTTFP